MGLNEFGARDSVEWMCIDNMTKYTCYSCFTVIHISAIEKGKIQFMQLKKKINILSKFSFWCKCV